jgi:hypothetical protein
VEGTGSYGYRLAQHLTDQGIDVVEVNRPDRARRRRKGKSDPVDAEAAARAVLAGDARAVPKDRNGAVGELRALVVARRSAIKARTQATNQIRALLVDGDDELGGRLRPLRKAHLARACAQLGPVDRGGRQSQGGQRPGRPHVCELYAGPVRPPVPGPRRRVARPARRNAGRGPAGHGRTGRSSSFGRHPRRPVRPVDSVRQASGIPGRAAVVNSDRAAAAWPGQRPASFSLVGEGREPGPSCGRHGWWSCAVQPAHQHPTPA